MGSLRIHGETALCGHCRKQLTFSTQITVCTNTCEQLSGLVASHSMQNKVPQRKQRVTSEGQFLDEGFRTAVSGVLASFLLP